MAIHGQMKMFSINFNQGSDSLDQSEMALPRNSEKWYGTVESFVKITQNLVGGNLASRTEVSNSKVGKRKLAEPADNTVDYKRMKVNLVNSDT